MSKGHFLKSAVLLSVMVLASTLMLTPAVFALSLEGVRSWYWTTDTSIHSVAVGDVDGDGETEIVTGGYYDDGTRSNAQLAVWNGSNLALEDVTTWYWVGSAWITSVAVGDVDGDGETEIVTGGGHHDGTRYNAQLAVWNGSTLALEAVTTWYWGAWAEIYSVAVGDVDGDGQTEIVTGGIYVDVRYNAQLAVWNGSNLALEDVTTWYWGSGTWITSVAVGDVDGDGQTEIVTGGYYPDGTRSNAQLAVWNGSNLALEDVTTWYWVDQTFILSVAVGDVDGDGQAEIVAGGSHRSGPPLHRDNAQLTVWDGATLTLEEVTTWYWTQGTRTQSVAVGDVDGDGQAEIVAGGWHRDGIRERAQMTVWNGSTLTLEDVETWYWVDETYVYSVAVGDVDGDSVVEIVTGGEFHDTTYYNAQLTVWIKT